MRIAMVGCRNSHFLDFKFQISILHTDAPFWISVFNYERGTNGYVVARRQVWSAHIAK